MIEKTAPCGSASTPMRPMLGASNGSTRIEPPSTSAIAAVASASSTRKYVIQCEGISAGQFSFISSSPPTACPSTFHTV
jgi:hypothetical protein